MNRIKVLGIGSPFGDDQAGWKVAELLKQQLPTLTEYSDRVIIEAHDRPGVRLLELMSKDSLIFLIDAVQSGSKPGTFHRLMNEEIYELKTTLSTHDMGVAQALELGRSLNELPEHIILYGIEIGSIELNSPLSSPVERAIKQVAVLLKNEISSQFV